MPSTYREPDELDEQPELLILAAAVRSAIDRAPKVVPPALRVGTEGGAIIVEGRVPNADTHDKVIALARDAAGNIAVVDRVVVVR